MAFGSGREDFKVMTPVERAMAMLAEQRPVLDGPGRDTFKSEDGRYFVMSREVTENEYTQFMEKYEALLEHEIEAKREEIRNAA